MSDADDAASAADASSLEAEVARHALDRGLLVPDERVLVAASAGADSTALAALLVAAREHGLPLEVVLGHVDHGWRGPEEAGADLQAVRSLARRLGVPLATAPPPEEVRRTEDDARRHRYTSLARLARQAGARKVATGHHLRDQAETFLMRLLRRSGPAGLASIPERRALHDGGTPILEVVRPLLDVHPARLRGYLRMRGLAWREDATNDGVDRDRAAIRARLAAAEARGAALDRRLAEAAARFRRACARRERDVRVLFAPSLRVHALAGAVEVALDAAGSLRGADWATGLRVLGERIAAGSEGAWFTRAHADLVATLVADGADGTAVDLPHGRRVLRLGRRVILSAAAPPFDGLRLDGDGSASTRAGRVAVVLSRRTVDAATFDLPGFAADRRVDAARASSAAALDADRLGARVVVRSPRPADRFEPLGRETGPIEVEAFLGKQGFPGVLRRGVVVLEATEGSIAWVVGHRIDRRFAVSDATTRVALLSVDLSP